MLVFYNHKNALFGEILRISLFGGIEGFFKKMEKDRVLPDIKTISLMLDTASFDSQQEKVVLCISIDH
jgi:hypothetical protein